jgi:oxygen-dependent protoporphyrinogen oxidase
MQTEVDAVIIGAGITGLVAAWKLHSEGKRVVLLEKAPRVGGQMETFYENGFVLESGPNTGVLNNVQTMALFEALAPLLAPQTAKPEAKVRLIWKKGAFRALPNGPVSAVTTPLFTFTDKLRVCFEPFRAKGQDPMESIAGITRRRLGKSFFDYAVDPFISGVYAGDPERLVTRYAMPKLYRLEETYGSFIKGALGKAKAPKSAAEKKVTKQVFSTEGGFGRLAETLEKALQGADLRTRCGRVEVEPNPTTQRWTVSLPDRGERIDTRCVISTVPGYALQEMLPFAEAALLKPIVEMPYAPVVQVGVGIRKGAERVPQAFGGLVPSCEQKAILGILFPSSCFPGRAPEGGATLSFFLGGRKHPEMMDLDDKALTEIVTNALEEMLGFPKEYTPEVLRIFRHERAIPQYEADSKERLEAIEALQKQHPGLILAGGIRDGIGVSDRIKQALCLTETA